jgi:hypothetical protein
MREPNFAALTLSARGVAAAESSDRLARIARKNRLSNGLGVKIHEYAGRTKDVM